MILHEIPGRTALHLFKYLTKIKGIFEAQTNYESLRHNEDAMAQPYE
jgi:hypothetical protein